MSEELWPEEAATLRAVVAITLFGGTAVQAVPTQSLLAESIERFVMDVEPTLERGERTVTELLEALWQRDLLDRRETPGGGSALWVPTARGVYAVLTGHPVFA